MTDLDEVKEEAMHMLLSVVDPDLPHDIAMDAIESVLAVFEHRGYKLVRA